MGNIKKTSQEWSNENPNVIIYDPDGWDRANFEESWNELITKEEYSRRLHKSTVLIYPSKFRDEVL